MTRGPRWLRSGCSFALLLTASCQPAHPAQAPTPVEHREPSARALELTPVAIANGEIRVARASAQTFTPRITAQATIDVDPNHFARVGARVPGRVVAIPVHLGERVRRGRVLASIDTVELHQVSMEYVTAIARANQANDALVRAQNLVAERVGAVQDLRRAEADAAATAATLHEAEEHLHFLGLADAQINSLRNQTTHGEARSNVRAPIDGVIASVSVSLGQVVAGTEDIMTIVQLDSVWAMIRVYERDLASVAIGTPVEIRLPSLPERPFLGQISYLGAVADRETHTVEARALLNNADGIFRPGMSAVATIALRSISAALWLPSDAVQPHEGGRVVFVQVAERRFEPRVVTTGEEQQGFVAITTGIAAGDEVVVHGAFALRGQLERAELEEE